MTLANITIPTPEPYNSDDPLKQHENLCYAILQLLQELQTNNIDIDIVKALRDLQFNGLTVDVPNLLQLRYDGKTASIGS